MKDTFYLNLSTADNLGIGLFKYSLSGIRRFIIVNSTLPQMLGYVSKKDFKKETLDNLFVNTADRETFFSTLRQEGKVQFFETILRHADGTSIWVAITTSQVISQDNHEYIEGIIENLSRHKKMEEELSREKDLMHDLLEHIPEAVYFKDHENKIIKINKFYIQGIGVKADEIIGKTDYDFFPKDQADRMFADDNYVLATGKPIVGKIERNLLPNGTWDQVITTKIPMYDRAGKIIGTMGITRDITAYANMEHQRLEMLINALTVLGKALEMRDPYTFSHTRRVANICAKIAQKLGWNDDRVLGIRLAGELHDLGKISIPLDILNKPGKLSSLEYQFVQEHVNKCYDLIKDIDFPFPLARTIAQHHERLDGTGYPFKLKENEISIEARVLAVSDVLEAITNHRPYREALGIEFACQELKKGEGTKFDSRIIQTAFELIHSNQSNDFWLDG